MGVEEMVQWLRPLIALPEDDRWILSTHMMAQTYL